MPFNLICVNDGMQIVLGDDGQPLSFEDGPAAAARAAALGAETGKRYQPRRAAVADPNAWKQREQARFDAGTYRRPLFVTEDWFVESPFASEHYLHVSTTNPELIAFTENAEAGQADRQTAVTVGRYLERFFSDLPARTRQYLVSQHHSEFVIGQVHITQDGDEIARLYQAGCHSCMAYDPSHYSGHIHPTIVYGGPDLGLAYLLNAEGRVRARAIVWPERQLYTRVYGDTALALKLQRMGYREGHLYGARIRKIMHRRLDSIVAPYIDYTPCLREAGDHLEIVRNSDRYDWYAQNTNGTAADYRGGDCACCGRRRRVSVLRPVVADINPTTFEHTVQQWCDACRPSSRVRALPDGTLVSIRFTAISNGVRVIRAAYRPRTATTRAGGRPERHRTMPTTATFGSDWSGAEFPSTEHTQVISINLDGTLRYWNVSREEARTIAARCAASHHAYLLADLVTYNGRRVNRLYAERARQRDAERAALADALHTNA